MEKVRLKKSYNIDRITSYNVCYTKLLREYPDLIILDHHMPYMDGFELASIISQSYSDHLPTMIMLTSGMLERQKATDSGIDRAIYKPVRKRQLYRALGVQKAAAQLNRITSYNVCYTKLLRVIMK